jgi:hypothetical protein
LNDDEVDVNVPLSEGTFEVEKFVDICYGDPNSTGKDGLCFKVLQARLFKVLICAIILYLSVTFILSLECLMMYSLI